MSSSNLNPTRALESSARQPTDRELADRVSAYLASRHLPTLRRLEVEARDGVVTLRGSVRTFYEKQVSHQSGQRVAGVRRLIDGIAVASSSSELHRLWQDVETDPMSDQADLAPNIEFFSL